MAREGQHDKPVRVLSADSHLDANPDHWRHRVPTKWKHEAQRVIRLEDGFDASSSVTVHPSGRDSWGG